MFKLFVLLPLAVLTACASVPAYVHLTPGDVERCETSEKNSDGCTVWTEEELEEFATYFYMEGVKAGFKKANSSI